MTGAKSYYQYASVILVGIVIFLLDYYELANNVLNEIILFAVGILKSGYFFYFVFSRIKESIHKEFYFDEFISFIGFSIVLIIISFATDYYCLYQIDNHAFFGIRDHSYVVSDWITFFYFSISAFTTAGLGDIHPQSSVAEIFVSMELMVAFFFTILVITNVLELRESFTKKKSKNYDDPSEAPRKSQLK
jgi:hypothetical protein